MATDRMIKLCTTNSAWDRDTKFDDLGRTKISKIFISSGRDSIKSLQFQYVEKDTLVLSEVYGGSGLKFKIVALDYPSEYITWIGGTFMSNMVTSLSIGTNKRKYGPFYGDSDSDFDKFKFDFGPNYFNGFFGTYSSYQLKSLGVYLNPPTSL